MRELRNCDFCTADAAGAFEVVPSELEPTDAEQRRVVLCPDCKDRLEVLLEPLLARAGVDGPAANSSDRDTAASADSREQLREPTNETTPGAAGEITFEDDDSDESPVDDGGTADDPSDAVADSSDDDPTTTDDSTGETTTADDSTDESTADDGSIGETSADGPTAGGRSTNSVADDRSAGSATDDRSTDGDASDESKTTSRSPQAYPKVVRLLRNREFPMDRTAVESLAAGAYDLENHEVEAIVDRAIERGEFVEDGGKLRRA